MASKWRKAKLALGCISIPRTLDDSPPLHSASSAADRSSSDAVSPSSDSPHPSLSLTPTPSSSGLRLSKHSSKSSKKTCAICLNSMTPGHGHAIFTAECSHSFHFNCITSNVRHGNRICPVCRAKWKEVPLQRNNSDVLPRKPRADPQLGGWSRDDALMAALRQLPQRRSDSARSMSSILYGSEPGKYDDDEQIDELVDSPQSSHGTISRNSVGPLDIKACPEVPAVSKASSEGEFTILIHLKAPQRPSNSMYDSSNSRAPVDLVTVLDVSGSMAGTKLALLKRAMGFVVQHLGPQDRLSVVAFSSTTHRLFPLRRMTEMGRTDALQAINSLKSNGGTNIAEGLKKGAKVMTERKFKNPVSSIILLSDGQDTYNVSAGSQLRGDYRSLLPTSIHIPVHTFGFGTDHDAASMHSISEISGGTFSFIEAEGTVQDAFAQCMGGLLSVVVQELEVSVECVHPSLQLTGIKAGSYQTRIVPESRAGSVDMGDLYAEEERDFLVMVNVPEGDASMDSMPLLEVNYSYKDPITKLSVASDEPTRVNVDRPEEIVGILEVSMEVDRQRNRLRAAEAMSEARAAAERGDLAGAASILDKCHVTLMGSVSSQLCVALEAELKEMQERMASRQVYEASGRAYVLSGLSSHSWQRATARGDSTDSTSLIQAYQTSSMVDMVTRSQTMIFGIPPSQTVPKPPRSLSARLRPR
ncbi:hypothetical protein V2J09_010826 [Rumex salicifolius]